MRSPPGTRRERPFECFTIAFSGRAGGRRSSSRCQRPSAHPWCRRSRRAACPCTYPVPDLSPEASPKYRETHSLWTSSTSTRHECPPAAPVQPQSGRRHRPRSRYRHSACCSALRRGGDPALFDSVRTEISSGDPRRTSYTRRCALRVHKHRESDCLHLRLGNPSFVEERSPSTQSDGPLQVRETPQAIQVRGSYFAWRLLSLRFPGSIIRRLFWKQYMNQMAIDFVELAANLDERLAIVLIESDDHRVQPPQRTAK